MKRAHRRLFLLVLPLCVGAPSLLASDYEEPPVLRARDLVDPGPLSGEHSEEKARKAEKRAAESPSTDGEAADTGEAGELERQNDVALTEAGVDQTVTRERVLEPWLAQLEAEQAAAQEQAGKGT